MEQILIETGELETTIMDCLYWDGEIDNGQVPEGAILVEGIVNKFGFHSERLESHRQQISDWLVALPHQFHKLGGGGWTFLNACTQENGVQWTGEHFRMEQLFCLGIGLGLVKCQLPRDMWSILPGGVPYYVIDLEVKVKE